METTKKPVKMVIVIAVGKPIRDTVQSQFDTIQSVLHYADPDTHFIVVDNSMEYYTGAKVKELWPEITLLRFEDSIGELGSLYRVYCKAFDYALEHFNFHILVKIDADAMLIDYGVADDAINYFKTHPHVGQIGKLCSVGDEIAWPQKWVLRQCGLLGFTRDLRMPFFMRKLLSNAQQHGYKPGYHILGGTNIMSFELISRLKQKGYLPHPIMQRARLQEDHIFSLLCAVVGLTFEDWSPPQGKIAAVWRGLPASPETLVAQGAKLIHSVRYFKSSHDNYDEATIRSYFRQRREA